MIELAVFIGLGVVIAILYEWREWAIRKGKWKAPETQEKCEDTGCASCALSANCEKTKKEE